MSRSSSGSSVTPPDDVEPEGAEISELIALAKAVLEGGATTGVIGGGGDSRAATDPPVTSSALAWAADPRVARRYLRAAAASKKPGVANALPLLTATARWRDEMEVDTMEQDQVSWLAKAAGGG